MARVHRNKRNDSWFSGGFPAQGITYKQFFFLYNHWQITKGLFAPSIISFLELSRMAPVFWLASLSRREAIDLISRIKEEESERRPISPGLLESLRDFQSERMEKVGAISAGCSSCSELWPENIPLTQIGDGVFLRCPSCGATVSLGIGES